MSKLNIGNRVRIADKAKDLYKNLLSENLNDFVIESLDIWPDGTCVVSLQGVKNFTVYGHYLEEMKEDISKYVVIIGDMNFFFDDSKGKKAVYAQAEALADLYGTTAVLYKLVSCREIVGNIRNYFIITN